MDFLPCFSLIHTKGKNHAVLDALSHLPALLAALPFVSSPWLSSRSAAQEGNSSLVGPICEAEQGNKNFTFSDGPHGWLLMFQGWLVIPHTEICKVLSEIHDKREHFV